MDYSCGVCVAEVKADDIAIQCEVDCMLWFHKSCTDLLDEEYELVVLVGLLLVMYKVQEESAGI